MYMCRPISKWFSSSQGGNEMEWNGVGIEILPIQSTLNLWRQDIPGGMTWGLWNTNCQFVCSTSSRLLCLQYNIPFSLRLRLQENTYYISNFRSLPEHCKIILAKTFCKHNLFKHTIMKWIHGIQCWKHLNPDPPHACVKESFETQLQLQLHNCTWCCTNATAVNKNA